MLDNYRASKSAYAFASHVNHIHKKISDKIFESNADYRLRADIKNDLKLTMLVIM